MSDKRFDRSKELLQRSLRVTPVGAQTYSKSYRYFSGNHSPYFLDRGKAGHVWDVDGNEFIDFILALGPVTIGYNNQEINEAIIKQLEKGITFSQATAVEVELAEKLIEIIPCAEMVRFFKNGCDATTAAVRLSRAATGRELVAVCGYHGMHDWYIGSTEHHRGVPQCVCDLSVTFEYNNSASLEKLFDQFQHKIAAVILEPVQGNGPETGFLEQVQDLTEKNGAVLIFDEIVSGFRLALGGGQECYKVIPDMAAFGKGMANGMALSAVVGKKNLLKLIEDGIFISTTFGGETLSIAAALKTIEILQRPGSFKHIWNIASRLMEESARLVRKQGLDTVITQWGLAPHSGFMFNRFGALDQEELFSVYQQRLIACGILTVGINNFCLEHTAEDISRYLQAIGMALEDVQKTLDQGSSKGILQGPAINPIFKRN